jgi:hypothetical protein
MGKSGKKTATRTLKPGRRAPVSGEQPPPPMPKSGQSYVIRAKSGRIIIKSPAQSSNSVSAWSKAFKIV